MRAIFVLFILCSITIGTITHASIPTVRGPSLSVIAGLAIFDACLLWLVGAQLRPRSAWLRAVQTTQIALLVFGVICYFYQRPWPRRILAAVREAVLEEYPDQRVSTTFYEVVLTSEGLVFWCWLQTNFSAEEKADLGDRLKRRVEGQVGARFPSLKRVEVTLLGR